MNTTKNISLGGYAFIIEEDAFDRLKRYTQAVEERLGSGPEAKEIMTDIEVRIAEIFRECLAGREVVSSADVEVMTGRMGDPDVYGTAPESASESHPGSGFAERRLFRDTDNKILGGVCGGLGAYAGIDPIWFRLAFAIAFFGYGTGVLLYIILWVIMPAAKSRAQKLQMRGKRPDLKNIEQSIKSEFQDISNRFSQTGADKTAREGADSLARTLNALFTRLFEWVGKVLHWVLKVFAVLVAISSLVFLVALVVIMISGSTALVVNDNQVELENIGSYLSFLFPDVWEGRFFYLFIFLFLSIPAVALLANSIRFLAGLNTVTPKWITFSGVVFWIASLAGLAYLGIKLGMDFSKSSAGKAETVLELPAESVLYLQAAEEQLQDKGFRVTDISLDIRESKDSLYYLKVIRQASGRTDSEADLRQKSIPYAPVLRDSVLVLPIDFFLQPGEVYRNQSVTLELKVPRGSSVFPAPGMQKLLSGVDNVQNLHDSEMVGLIWDMTPAGLSCRGCSEPVNQNSSVNP